MPIKVPVAYFTEDGRLETSLDMVNPLLNRPRGVIHFKNAWEAKILVSFLHKELEPKVEKLRHMKLEVMKPKIKIKGEGTSSSWINHTGWSVHIKCY